MYKVIVFPSKEITDEMLLDLSVTPHYFVWFWSDPDKKYEVWDEELEEYVEKQYHNKIQYNQSLDGRCAVAHDFGQTELEWLQEYWYEDVGTYENGVLFLDALPEDWQYAGEA